MREQRSLLNLNAGLNVLGAYSFSPDLEPFLKNHYPGFRKRYLYGFEDFLFRRTVVQGGPDVALDVGFRDTHNDKTDHEDQLLRLATEAALFEVHGIDELPRLLHHLEVLLLAQSRDLVSIHAYGGSYLTAILAATRIRKVGG